VAEALERDAHTIGDWMKAFQEQGPTGLEFVQTVGPPVLNPTEQAKLKAAIQVVPKVVGIEICNWNWKGVCACSSGGVLAMIWDVVVA
jgi:hypothetical protein